jgi:hypothetical protein
LRCGQRHDDRDVNLPQPAQQQGCDQPDSIMVAQMGGTPADRTRILAAEESDDAAARSSTLDRPPKPEIRP